MKFARYLDENTVPEWKRVYIQYRGLKKLCKRVAQHREARLHFQDESSLTHPDPSPTAGPSTDGIVRRRKRLEDGGPAAALETHSGHRQRQNYGSTLSAAVSIQPVSLEGTGLHLSSAHPDYVSADTHTQPDTQRQDLEAAAVPQTSGDQETGTEQKTSPTQDTVDPLTLPPAQSQPNPALNVHYPGHINDSTRSPKQTKQSNSSRASSRRGLLDRANSLSHSSLRSNRSEVPLTLDELISTYFDEQEAKFFSVCDNELERITAFYDARESEAVHKYQQLTRQLKELAEHRREYRAKYATRDSDKTVIGGARSRLTHILSIAPSHLLSNADDWSKSLGNHGQRGDVSGKDVQIGDGNGKSKQSESQDRGDKRRAEALAQMQDSLRGWDDETDQQVRAANKAAALSHDPEAYAAARKKLKATVLEYYKFLETLNNYKILNRTGFAKVMKKFSKTVGVPCADVYYRSRVAPSVLVTSERIPKLIKATEDIYAAYFEHGNRKQAINRLRVREEHTSHHFSVFRTGLYLGISLCATIAGLIQAMHPETQRRIPNWQAILRVYGAEFIPTLFALLFGLNLSWWHYVRINTVFIFEWDVRHTMDHRRFFEIPALLMLLLSVFFWVSFVNPFPTAIEPTTWPAVWLVVVTVVMLNPLPIFSRESRSWFVVSLARVFTAGFKGVEFRDFFLGDELNSVAWSMSNFWYVGCEWHHDWAYPDRCAPNDTYWTAVLLSMPAVLRLGQCIRRWKDSDYQTYLHLVNAGKYGSAILNNFFYLHYRRTGSHTGGNLALWLVFACIYSVWHILWDLIMDWSLLRPRAKHFLLRSELSFPVPIYYVFMAVDIIGRCNWIVYLFPGSATVTLRSFLAALVEMIRRVCWNNLRVENEQIGNTDSFKVIRDLPLPYRHKMRDDDLDEADESGRMNAGGIFGTVKMANLGRKSRSLSADAAEATSTETVSGRQAKANQFQTGDLNQGKSDMSTTASANSKSPLLERLRHRLVPDAEGSAYGSKLDERGATKGNSGRDYSPRAGELDESDEDNDSGVSTAAGDETNVAL